MTTRAANLIPALISGSWRSRPSHGRVSAAGDWRHSHQQRKCLSVQFWQALAARGWQRWPSPGLSLTSAVSLSAKLSQRWRGARLPRLLEVPIFCRPALRRFPVQQPARLCRRAGRFDRPPAHFLTPREDGQPGGTCYSGVRTAAWSALSQLLLGGHCGAELSRQCARPPDPLSACSA